MTGIALSSAVADVMTTLYNGTQLLPNVPPEPTPGALVTLVQLLLGEPMAGKLLGKAVLLNTRAGALQLALRNE
jgi:hypothetical protein